jgi:2-iminobutanoate/2-iminopropanoate deaminase
MEKRIMSIKNGPLAVAPESQVVIADKFVFVAGQGPIVPGTDQVLKGTFEEQVRLVMDNIKLYLKEAGTTVDQIVKMNVFVSDMSNFSKLNPIYESYFKEKLPARTCIEAKLYSGILVEMDAIAYIP